MMGHEPQALPTTEKLVHSLTFLISQLLLSLKDNIWIKLRSLTRQLNITKTLELN